MIPHDLDAEAAVIGAVLTPDRMVREYALAQLTVRSFYDVKHQAVWVAITFLVGTGKPVDVTTLAAEMARQKTLERCGGKGFLLKLFAEGSSLSWRAHVDLVADRAVRRQLMALGEDTRTKAEDLAEEPAAIVAGLERAAESVTLPIESITAPLDLDDYLAIEDPPEDFIIPKMLARGDRLILTSAEGTGKSELQLQMAVCVASGVHPFFGYQIPKSRALVIDLENAGRQLRPRLRKFRAVAGDRYQGGFRIVERTQGLNLRDPRDFRWLDQQLELVHPDLVTIGPLYKMFRAKGNESKADETAAEEAAYAIDRLRARHGCAFTIEAHSPHGHQGDREHYRPIGASLWLRWPEFGIALAPTGDKIGPMRVDVKHWRGARDRDRRWPKGLIEGGDGRWPWLATDDREAL